MRTRSTTWAGARSPTIASAGSMGTTRPMKKVTASRPRKVVTTVSRKPRIARPRRLARLLPRQGFALLSVMAKVSYRSVLGDGMDEIGIEARAELVVLQLVRIARNLGLLEDDDIGPPRQHFLLQFLVDRSALVGVLFEQRGLRLLAELFRVPGIAPGERLVGALVGIIGIIGESIGIRVRIEIVRAPLADIHVVLAGTVLGQRLLAVARDDLQRNAGLRQGLLEIFGNPRHRLGIAHVHGNCEAVG